MEAQEFEFQLENDVGESKPVTVTIKQAADISIPNLRKWCQLDDNVVLLVWIEDKAQFQPIETEEHLGLVRPGSRLKVQMKSTNTPDKDTNTNNNSNIDTSPPAGMTHTRNNNDASVHSDARKAEPNGEVHKDSGPPLSEEDWRVGEDEVKEYKKAFDKDDQDEKGFIADFEMDDVFLKYGVEKSDLRTIWGLADLTKDERVDQFEYAVVRFLIKVRLRGCAIPESLPASFLASLKSVEVSRIRHRSSAGVAAEGRGRRNAFYGAQPEPVSVPTGPIPLPANSTSGKCKPFRLKKGSRVVVASNSTPATSPTTSPVSSPPSTSTSTATSLTNDKELQKKIRVPSTRFQIGFADTIGKRRTMEDELVIVGRFRGHEDEDYMAVFDGHGGSDASAFSAEKLHNILEERLTQTGNPIASLKAAFLETHALMEKENIKGGTTALVSLFVEDKGYIANAGDSRAVLCRDGLAVRCSIDHKPDLPEEEKRIYDLGGNVTTSVDKLGRITSRVCGVLAVARALGDFNLQPYVSPEPQVHGPFSLDPANKNYFLIMACDGLWDKVTDEEAVAIVAPVADVEQAAIKLRDFAFQQGSDDNISVVVIRFPPFHPFTPKE